MPRALRGFGISFDKDDPPRATRNKYNQAKEERGAIARYRAASDDRRHSVDDRSRIGNSAVADRESNARIRTLTL